jgi:hypothetical protein
MTSTTLFSDPWSGQPEVIGNPKSRQDFAQNHIKTARFSMAFIWFS